MFDYLLILMGTSDINFYDIFQANTFWYHCYIRSYEILCYFTLQTIFKSLVLLLVGSKVRIHLENYGRYIW